MANPLIREAKTQALNLLIKNYTGEFATIKRYSSYNQILLNSNQNYKLQGIVEDWWNDEPSDVRVNVAPVLVPIIIKKYWPWAVGTFVLGALAGFVIRPK